MRSSLMLRLLCDVDVALIVAVKINVVRSVPAGMLYVAVPLVGTELDTRLDPLKEMATLPSPETVIDQLYLNVSVRVTAHESLKLGKKFDQVCVIGLVVDETVCDPPSKVAFAQLSGRL
jgi:hypothetical protein